MCDEFESGFDSLDDVSGSFDDVSVDDLSSSMDEVPIMDDDIASEIENEINDMEEDSFEVDLETPDEVENADLLEDSDFMPSEMSENSALDNMTEYMYEHNYGREDFETYSQDPEWQQLNNELLESDGREPIDYSENTETSALDNMTEYMYEHNYGREDFETYSQDPEWQQLNNELLESDGREPIDYDETGETFSEDTDYDDIPESEPSISDIMDNVEVDDMESLDDDVDNDLSEPDSSVEEWMNDVMDDDISSETENEINDMEEDSFEVDLETPDEVENADSLEGSDFMPSEMSENSALDNMTEYMYEHNYGREDFETYSQDPEWQQLNNDLLQEMGHEPIDYDETGETFIEDADYNDISESEPSISDIMDNVEVDDMESLDDTAADNPTVAEEIESVDVPYDIEHNVEFAESLLEDRPELTEMFENGEFFEQGNNEHGFEGTCGETTQANTLNKLLGSNEITENDVLNIAIENDLCEMDALDPANSGGTSTEQFMQLYDEMNHRVGDKLNVELFDYEDALDIDDMASRVENGSVLNIAVDSCELWDLPRDVTDTAHYTDHWISVTGVDRSIDGDIVGFKIVDSGGGESYLDVNKFERCYYGAKDSPVIDPTCIVVSRKGK